MDRIELIVAVLGTHTKGNTSAGTHFCVGCSKAVRAEVEARWPHAQDEAERQALRGRLSSEAFPEWSLEDYNRHVATVINEALGG